MNFPEAIRNGLRHYANGAGRASRSEFWYWTLFYTLLSEAFGFAEDFAAQIPVFEPFVREVVRGYSWADLAFEAVFLLPNLAVTFRRLHDLDRSYRWYYLSLTGIGLIFPLLIWECTAGTKGPNRFGPDPLQNAATLF